MNIHALYSLILTSSTHLFCKGLSNTTPTTFVLLAGLSKTSSISLQGCIHNRKCVWERRARPANAGPTGHWCANAHRSNDSHSPVPQGKQHLPSPTEPRSNLEDHRLLIKKAAHRNSL